MTIDEVTMNRPKASMGSSVTSWFWRLKLFQVAMKFSAETFTPCGLLPPLCGFSEFVVSSLQTILLYHLLLGTWILLPFVISRLLSHQFLGDEFLMHPCFPIPQISAIRIFTFQMLPAINAKLQNIPGKTSLQNWWSLDWSFAPIGAYSTRAPNGITGPLQMVLRSRPFIGCSSQSARRS